MFFLKLKKNSLWNAKKKPKHVLKASLGCFMRLRVEFLFIGLILLITQFTMQLMISLFLTGNR